MPTTPSKKTQSLDDYADFFGILTALGIEHVAIGGCAVAAYARSIGEEVVSADLDLLVPRSAVALLAEPSLPSDVKVLKWPQPRTVPVVVIEWRALEVNLLTATSGMPPAEIASRVAREFRLRSRPDVTVLVADPFDLLRNKLAVNRPKDRPHIRILRRFLDEEVVRGFEHETDPRERLVAASRLLQVLDAKTLEGPLGERLVELARLAPDFRFLAHRLPSRALTNRLLARVEDAALGEEVRRVLARRRFSRR